MPCLILPKSRFLHIPKTGGKWVQQALQAGGMEFEKWPVAHCGLAEAPEPDLFTFAFVRNPLTWLQSIWRYRMARDWPRGGQAFRIAAPGKDIEPLFSDSFAEFVKNFLDECPGYCSWLFERFVGTRGAPIDYIGKQETLAADLVGALEAAGEEFNRDRLIMFPPYHMTDKTWNADYTPELAAAVIMAEREAIGRFGYGEDCEREMVRLECYQPDQRE